MTQSNETVLVIGGTGAMGGAVVRALLERSRRTVRVFTRDPASVRVQDLVAEGNGRITAARGNLDDESSLRSALAGVDAVFCNTDFWSTGSPSRGTFPRSTATAAVFPRSVTCWTTSL